MGADHRVSYRFRDEDVANVRELSLAWGGINPAPDVEVIRQALRLAVQQVRKSGAKPTPRKKENSV